MFYLPADAQESQSVFDIDRDTAEVRLVRAIRPTKVSIVVQVGLTVLICYGLLLLMSLLLLSDYFTA